MLASLTYLLALLVLLTPSYLHLSRLVYHQELRRTPRLLVFMVLQRLTLMLWLIYLISKVADGPLQFLVISIAVAALHSLMFFKLDPWLEDAHDDLKEEQGSNGSPFDDEQKSDDDPFEDDPDSGAVFDYEQESDKIFDDETPED